MKFLGQANGALVLVKSEQNRVFGLLAPINNFAGDKEKGTTLAFYMINNNADLVTAVRKDKPTFQADEAVIFSLWGASQVFTDRSREDEAYLADEHGWVNHRQSDATGYPKIA